MNEAYLLIGGNLGDRLANLDAAMQALSAHCGRVQKASAVYETAAWGLEEQPAFLNQAVQIGTQLSPGLLLDRLLQIERALGRIRNEKYGPRLIDIDILLFNDQVIDQPGLKIPHPRLPHRRFALQCLADIAPDVVHPVLKKNMRQLLEECTDSLAVHKFP